jgi:DNA-binding transcriptional LysR family regulator
MDNILPLRLLVLVARTGSFSGAGRVLGLSPGSVFRYINQLEDEVGATLFNRSSRKITLTQIGATYLDRASDLIQKIDRLASDIQEAAGGHGGKLHVHSRLAVGRHLLVPSMPAIVDDLPDVLLRLTMSDESLDLVESNIDLSITTEMPSATSYIARPLITCRRRICASRAYLERQGIPLTPDDLARHDCVVYSFDLGEPAWAFRRNGSVQVIRPNAVIHTNDGSAMISLALQGAGLVMLPDWLVGPKIRSGALVPVLADYECTPRTRQEFEAMVLAVYQRTRHPARNLRLFLAAAAAALRKHYRDAAEGG